MAVSTREEGVLLLVDEVVFVVIGDLRDAEAGGVMPSSFSSEDDEERGSSSHDSATGEDLFLCDFFLTVGSVFMERDLKEVWMDFSIVMHLLNRLQIWFKLVRFL